ncbi:DUF2946 family protein [Rhodopseudomonas palustris]|uniref:DUF2946 domain-containing protein n=1 Tax=Rhodopseudomonas palustris (strain BisB18) TaxID=316056 RepID=Q20XX8_RHOPB
MGKSRQTHAVGLTASFIAAYALVLNVVLSSLLLAALSPTAQVASAAICVTHPDQTTGVPGDDKPTGIAVVHCPACIGNHAPGAPPAIASFAITRIAVAIEAVVPAANDRRPRQVAAGHRARAPPQLS